MHDNLLPAMVKNRLHGNSFHDLLHYITLQRKMSQELQSLYIVSHYKHYAV